MFSNKAFAIALALSIITHGILLFKNPNLNLNILPKDKKEPILEVSYVKSPQESQKNEEYPKTSLTKKEPFLKLSTKITATKMMPPAFIDRENIFKRSKEGISQKYVFDKPAFVKPDIIAVKKKITLPPVDIDKIDNPSYISYYQIVREKIRRAAYQNYTRAEVGEAYLSFLISSDGSLKAVQLIEEKSSPSTYLKEISLRSIKEASPFPNFPEELDYPHLSFNVVISFEIE
ncbi:MAG: TonB C-terminal domain-containing protein [Candidatus Omnitrophota bacterium]|nr:TonB C-terminal domain-containing protein [Candidatus Omnitrophota bacterium]